MKILVNYEPHEQSILVRRVGSLEGVINRFNDGIYLAYQFNRAALRGRRIRRVEGFEED